MKKEIKQKIESMRKLFAREKTVKLAYLFGSYATNKRTKLSDVDIAVLFDNKLNKSKMFKKELELINELSGLFKDFDLVVLNNDIDILLKYNIIRTGILLKDSRQTRPEFEYNLMNEYLDRQHHEQLRADILINRFCQRGLK
ncbi:MAG: nucleotidyltransferase domain-containing protein [Candidatus Aenigmarchaeota archaeon]|nr:nucleotidyltransferase domain-containing protein [Candidatus Aenigmarchaeota archaeon]